jgi:ADP-heptose:LPS heptosyltransferase
VGAGARATFDAWKNGLRPDEGKRWIGVGTGSNQPVNRWPVDRYADVLHRLVAQHDIWPVFFGGGRDRADATGLMEAIGRGHDATGLAPPAAILALGQCAMFLGNDTGTIHLAAAANTPCVGVYSSRNYPGMWYPYGAQHVILRTPVDCENCELFACIERGMACILSITPTAVAEACHRLLTNGARR